MDRDTTIQALEALHHGLLSQAEGPEHAQALMALAASVPQLAPLIESRVPSVPTIMRPEAIRALLVEVAIDLLQTQATAVSNGSVQAPKYQAPGR